MVLPSGLWDRKSSPGLAEFNLLSGHYYCQIVGSTFGILCATWMNGSRDKPALAVSAGESAGQETQVNASLKGITQKVGPRIPAAVT